MNKKPVFIFGFLICCLLLNAQILKPGFDKDEFTALIKVSAQFGDSTYAGSLQPPPGYRMVYRSPVVGLDNRWDFWQAANGAGVISIRGTTVKEESWLANLYAAMVPAKGELQLSQTEKFAYNLADHPRAAVHVGWLVATGFLAKDILSKIDSSYKAGLRNFYVVGSSQGGAIAYLLTAYLYQRQKQGSLPKDVRLKTYCCAAPKPGNVYFSYAYDAMTQAGWSYSVVNAADWVPQSPFSVQTVDDFAELNPFANAGDIIKKQGWPKRWGLRIAYNRLANPSKKAVERYKKYLGGYVSKSVKKKLKGFAPPDYLNTSDYVQAGAAIVLMPGPDYFEKFPQVKDKIFINHLHPAYLYLLNQLNADGSAVTKR